MVDSYISLWKTIYINCLFQGLLLPTNLRGSNWMSIASPASSGLRLPHCGCCQRWTSSTRPGSVISLADHLPLFVPLLWPKLGQKCQYFSQGKFKIFWGIWDLTCAKWPSSSRFSCSKVSTWRKIRCVRNLLLKEAKLWLPTLEGGRPWTHNFNTRSPHKSSFYWNFPGYRLWMRSV